jgi:heptosyltransferase-2
MPVPRKILIIQTASVGDVILATPVVESLSASYPGSSIDFLVRRGTESLLKGHPLIHEVLTWDKKHAKLRTLIRVIHTVKRNKYDLVVNINRFLSSGLITALSGASVKAGFDKNPLSVVWTHKTRHIIGRKEIHEIDRNLSLVSGIASVTVRKVKLYPFEEDFNRVAHLKKGIYYCMAPASIWFTKQYPEERWAELIMGTGEHTTVYLLGSSGDHELCARIIQKSGKPGLVNLCGQLTFLQSAALMKDARMNFVNDSAPLHLASAVNAPVTAIFCSTVPDFGFGPLSEDAMVVESREILPCRPCGLHGYRKCPEKHFRCATTIDNFELLNRS